jgi:lysophospholipid acyltransferase (LPLAT)-like uncharacterized protein
MLKSLWRSNRLQVILGTLLAWYLSLVRETTVFTIDPPNGYDAINQNWPVVVTIWHGQHFMLPFARQPQHDISVLISNHGDGELNAIAAKKLGIGLIRGSGALKQYQIAKRGGAKALRTMIERLKLGKAVAMTADIPKISRVCGIGIITLARISGCPIVPIAVVTKRRLDFKSWDFASIGLPFFNRGAIILGEPIYVPRDADESQLETIRLQVEDALDEVHARGYELLACVDPGANQNTVLAARANQRAHI